MLETFLEGVLFVTDKLLCPFLEEAVGTKARQNSFPPFMYLLRNIFLSTELKHIIYECINGLFYPSLDFEKSLRIVQNELAISCTLHLRTTFETEVQGEVSFTVKSCYDFQKSVAKYRKCIPSL